MATACKYRFELSDLLLEIKLGPKVPAPSNIDFSHEARHSLLDGQHQCDVTVPRGRLGTLHVQRVFAQATEAPG